MIPLNSTMEKSLAFTMEFSLPLRQGNTLTFCIINFGTVLPFTFVTVDNLLSSSFAQFVTALHVEFRSDLLARR